MSPDNRENKQESMEGEGKKKVEFGKKSSLINQTFPRLIEKSGLCNIESRTIETSNHKCIQNIFIVLMDTQWRLIMPLFVVSVVISWLVFASIYYGISAANGDFDNGAKIENWKFCVENSPDFISMLLFSMETQTTIGYGYRYVNDECSGSVLFVMIQSIWGALLQALLTGFVIAKVQKPKRRTNTLIFSKQACIYQMNEARYLTIRIGDLQKSNLIDLQARAICVKDKITAEGEYISHFRYDLDFRSDKVLNRVTLGWPVILYHRISPESPFWELSAEDIRESNFEVIMFLVGTIESTGLSLEARTSYLPSEILWGRKFKRMGARWKENGVYEFDFRQFHVTETADVKTPPCMQRISRTSRNSKTVSPTGSFIESGLGLCDGLDSVSLNSDGDYPLINNVKKCYRNDNPQYYENPT